MAYINFTSYQSVIDNYSFARAFVQEAVDYLEAAVEDIVLLNVVQPEVDLLQSFWNTYLLGRDTFGTTSTFLEAVRALQNHIIVRSDDSTVSAWLDDQDSAYQVPNQWADLSEDAGYAYTAGKINGSILV